MTPAPTLTISAIAMGGLLLALLIYYGTTRYLEYSRQKKREEEQALQDELNRIADIPGPGPFTADVSIDAKNREEMLENAREMAKKNPKETAQLLRNWMDD